MLRQVEKFGFVSIRWSVDTLDAVAQHKTPAFIQQRVLAKTDSKLCGAIVLMHVGYPETVAAVSGMIRALKKRDFSFVTISDWMLGR